MDTLRRLCADERGFVYSGELVLIATLMVIGLIVGLTTARDQIVQELGDVALGVAETNMSYSYSAITGHGFSVGGSVFHDVFDDCDEAVNGSSNCITFGPPSCSP